RSRARVRAGPGCRKPATSSTPHRPSPSCGRNSSARPAGGRSPPPPIRTPLPRAGRTARAMSSISTPPGAGVPADRQARTVPADPTPPAAGRRRGVSGVIRSFGVREARALDGRAGSHQPQDARARTRTDLGHDRRRFRVSLEDDMPRGVDGRRGGRAVPRFPTLPVPGEPGNAASPGRSGSRCGGNRHRGNRYFGEKVPEKTKGPAPLGCGAYISRRLDRADVLSLRTLLALPDLELHALALVEGLETRAADGGVVHEDVRAASVLGDEAEALLAVEPFHAALSHVVKTSFL